jgi:hypothetical protein
MTQAQVKPTERVHLTPAGIGVERNVALGTTSINFLVSPFKVVTIELLDEYKDELVKELTGVEIARVIPA